MFLALAFMSPVMSYSSAIWMKISHLTVDIPPHTYHWLFPSSPSATIPRDGQFLLLHTIPPAILYPERKNINLGQRGECASHCSAGSLRIHFLFLYPYSSPLSSSKPSNYHLPPSHNFLILLKKKQTNFAHSGIWSSIKCTSLYYHWKCMIMYTCQTWVYQLYLIWLSISSAYDKHIKVTSMWRTCIWTIGK